MQENKFIKLTIRVSQNLRNIKSFDFLKNTKDLTD